MREAAPYKNSVFDNFLNDFCNSKKLDDIIYGKSFGK